MAIWTTRGEHEPSLFTWIVITGSVMALQDPRHLAYYEKELAFLRNAGKTFASQYPKIASRLAFGGTESPDPHVERLLESFAFLTSYLQKDIDDQFPRLATNLLDILYPQLTAPLPPMSVASFVVDATKGVFTSGYAMEKGFPLITTASSGEVCRFRTAYPLTLWPIRIANIQVVRSDTYDFAPLLTPYPFVLKIELETESVDFEQMEMSSLRFYMDGDPLLTNTLFEYLFLVDHKYAIVQLSNDPTVNPDYKIIPPGNVGRVGFRDDENVLPNFPQSHAAYRLLQEYFVFPQKFMFFDINNMALQGATRGIELVIPLASHSDQLLKNLLVTNETLKLGCTPIINLFPKITDPIRFDKKQIEYNLYPDIRRMSTLEIHSIEKVTSTETDNPETKEFSPYFSYAHDDIRDQKDAFWYARRMMSTDPNLPGTTIKLSFVDLDFNPDMPTSETAYARTWCTNRGLASFVYAGTLLSPEDTSPTKEIVCLDQPTPPIYPDRDGASQWKLISQLSLNYLSLSSGKDSLTALKEILTLYAGAAENTFPLEINNILALESRHVVRRFGKDAWRGFVKGTAVTLTLDEPNFIKKEAVLFSAVLSHFFGLYTTVNSFTELSIKRNFSSDIWKTWPPIAGETPLL